MSLKKSKFNHKDKRFMRLALNLASDRIGLTGENPSVGCVIVKNNEVHFYWTNRVLMEDLMLNIMQ